GGRVADEGTQGRGLGGRYAIARLWSVQRFQSSPRLVAVGPLGFGKCRQSRQSAGLGRHAGRRLGEGEGRNRRPRAPDCARLIILRRSGLQGSGASTVFQIALKRSSDFLSKASATVRRFMQNLPGLALASDRPMLGRACALESLKQPSAERGR